MHIQLIPHHKINKKKYDDCIENSLQGTVYAMSWYLDVVAPGWQVLASIDYQIVMPLPYKKKHNIPYSIQPSLCQQLGIFSSEIINIETLSCFIKKIPYPYYDLQFNSGNLLEYPGSIRQQNYFLDLNLDYQTIQSQYKSNCKRNIKKAEKENLQVSNTTEQVAYLKILTDNSQNRPIRNMIPLLKNLLDASRTNTQTEIWQVTSEQGIILSSVFFLYWKNRVYYMVPVSSAEGKQKQSMSFLIDAFIRANSSSGLILDFEGSSIPEIARFYEGFGAVQEIYPRFIKKGFFGRMYSIVKKLR